MTDADPIIRTTDLAGDTMAEMLDRTSWARDFSWVQLKKIASHLRAYEAQEGAVLFEEGQNDPSLYIIARGSVDIIKADRNRGKKVLASLHAPQSFGEMCLIDGEPRSAAARASSKLVFFIMAKDDFFALAGEAPKLALRVLWNIASDISQRLRRTSGRLVEYMPKED